MGKDYDTQEEIQQLAKNLYKQVEGEGYTTIGSLLGVAYFFLEEVIEHFNAKKGEDFRLLKAYFLKYAKLLTRHFGYRDITVLSGLIMDEAHVKITEENKRARAEEEEKKNKKITPLPAPQLKPEEHRGSRFQLNPLTTF
ncbi:hypothetical protein KJ557_02470 [Patescibacteria group bacterium]|nr:hypothetical protein [Patescibacteria group bacterium]MBU1956488.1 hypothetical protein [Patescibacteria group bacterium]MBU2010286.1 hypothetical protein [Patescibacteria group bacterium]